LISGVPEPAAAIRVDLPVLVVACGVRLQRRSTRECVGKRPSVLSCEGKLSKRRTLEPCSGRAKQHQDVLVFMPCVGAGIGQDSSRYALPGVSARLLDVLYDYVRRQMQGAVVELIWLWPGKVRKRAFDDRMRGPLITRCICGTLPAGGAHFLVAREFS